MGKVFFWSEIFEISPKTVILAAPREILIPFKKIRFGLNLNSRKRSYKLRMVPIAYKMM
jgi:hypothetical protein